MMKLGIGVALCSAFVSLPALASTTYSGITFPLGDISFADAVVTSVLGDGVEAPYSNPLDALGAPDYVGPPGYSASGAFSLGSPGITPDNLADTSFGSITVRFIDNALTASGDSGADLFIFEIGPIVEPFSVEISTDGTSWLSAGTLSGQPTQIDIDAITGVTINTNYHYVRVTDAPGSTSSNPYAGPDIDAIGAISTVVVPLPAAGWALIAGLAGLAWLPRKSRLTS